VRYQGEINEWVESNGGFKRILVVGARDQLSPPIFGGDKMLDLWQALVSLVDVI
jgi:hypothetical protein